MGLLTNLLGLATSDSGLSSNYATYCTMNARCLQVYKKLKIEYNQSMNQQLLITIIADWSVVPVVLLGAYALLFRVPKLQKYDTYTRVLLAGLTAYTVAKIVGFLYQPTGLRPFERLGVEAGASFLNNPGFPSDHVLFTMAITLAILLGAKQKKLALVAAILTLIVALGRVLALVHTPLDVIGGAVIACSGVIWYLSITRRVAKKQH